MESIFKLGILLRVTDLVSGPVTAIGRTIDTLEAKVKKLQPVFDKFRDFGAAIAGAGVVGALGIGIAVTQFANLEEAQNRLQTTLMNSVGQIGPEYEQLIKLSDRLGTALPGSSKDMIEMFIALREQGVPTNVILGGMGEAAAKFAVLMGVPFVQAATHVAKFSEALGIADKEAVPFMDILQRLKNAAGVNVNDLSESLKYSGAALKALRVQGLAAGWEVSAAFGMMATSSIEGSQAGTNFAMALTRMAEISSRLDSGKIRALIGPILDAKGIKLNFFDDDGNFVGIRGMIAEMEKLRAINPQEQLLVLSKLFGQEAAKPLSVFINQGVAGFDAMTLRMKTQADMQTKINKIMSGTKEQWGTLTGTLANVVAHTGAVISKVTGLIGILERINALAGRLDNWIMANPQTAGIIAGIAVAITATALAMGGLLLAIGLGGTLFVKMAMGAGLLTQGLSLLGLAIKALPAAIYAVDVALVSSGWGLIILAIGLTIAQLMWAHTKFESFRTAIQFFYFFLGYYLGQIAKVAMGFYTALAHPILFIQALLWGVGQILGSINLFDSGRAIISTLVSGITSMAAAPVNAVKGIFAKMRNLLPFSDAKEGPLSQLTLSGQRIMTTMGDGIAGAAAGLQRTMATALAGAALTTSIAVQPPGFDSAQPTPRSPSGVEGQRGGDGKKITIQINNLNLPGVSNGHDFVKQLQALVEGYDV